MKNEIIFHNSKEEMKIFLPEELLKNLIWECHEAYGHIGPKKTHKILTEHFYYPHLARLIRIYLKTCDSCQRNKIPTTGISVTLESVQPHEPLDLISIDFFEPLTRSTRGYQHILVMMDTFTKYTKLYTVRKATTDTSIQKLDEFFADVGQPKYILSDRGTQFTSKKWEEALKERNIKMISSSVRHPQGNMVERVNREIARFFRTFLPPERYSSWYVYLETIETIMNESYHGITEIPPHEALRKEKPTRFWEKWLKHVPTMQNRAYEEQVRLIRDRIKTKGEKRNALKNKDKVNKEYHIGEEVLLKACNISSVIEGKVAKISGPI